MEYTFTQHALMRMNQRGFTQELISLFLKLFDLITHTHGAERIAISESSLNDGLKSKFLTDQEKKLAKQNLTKLRKTQLVVSGQTVITVMLVGGGL